MYYNTILSIVKSLTRRQRTLESTALETDLWKLLIRFRTTLIVFMNLVFFTVAFVLALSFRFDFNLTGKLSLEFAGLPLLVLLAIRTWTYAFFDLNRGYWRFVSTHEAIKLFKAHLFGSLLFAASLAFLNIEGFPRSFVPLEFMLSLLLCTGARLYVRIVCERVLSAQSDLTLPMKEIVVVGAGIGGHMLIKTLTSQPRVKYLPVAVFDDSERTHGTTVHGVPVVGSLADVPGYLRAHPRIVSVISAIPSLSNERFQELELASEAFHVPVKRLRTFENIACEDLHEPRTSITIEEVLDKEVEIEHEDEIRQAVAGRVVMITGAGGSIGSELVRQVLSFGPSKLVMLDHSEYNLYAIDQELSGDKSDTQKICVLASIKDRRRIENVFVQHTPEMVFHAAAYKHVPLLEANAYEGFVNNVIGTRCLLRAARKFGTKRFVLISTDKAVDPSSLMGATKRITELMVKGANSPDLFDRVDSVSKHTSPEYRSMQTAVVRFGNVINSAGSVIPLFKKQILSGGPITVTHEKMERYFMSIREAVRLVLTAGTLGEQGEIYLLNMGSPIRVIDVAKKLRALYGRRDVPIKIVGLRPGEKLTERLYSDNERREPSQFRKVFTVHPKRATAVDIFAWVDFVYRNLDHLTDYEIAEMISKVVTTEHEPGFQSFPKSENGVRAVV